MRNKTGAISTIVIGLIVAAFSVIAFFLLDIKRTSLQWWALTFLLLSEFALFSGLVGIRFLSANHSKVFMRSGVTTTLVLYFFATLVSVLFVNGFAYRINAFILMELAIMVIFAIVIISIFSISRGIAIHDRSTVNGRGFMEDCEHRVGSLLADIHNKDYVGVLNSVYESIKYSDKIGSSSVDMEIYETMAKLEASLGDDQKSKEDIMSVFDEISSLIGRRKAEISQTKRGSF